MNHPYAVITRKDDSYPPLLREIHDPPRQLYVRGDTHLLSHPYLLAVVGSRKAGTYGNQCASILLPPLARAGLPLVSGLAFGIDSLAHRACVDYSKPTVAVLGSGIDDSSIYPRSHYPLAHHILNLGGALVSEYPPGTPAYKGNFPERNRIIAGLCRAVLIVRAGQRSGSLITARLALEGGRDVLAVPGPITDPSSYGTNELIKHGAMPITMAEDILTLLDIPALDNAEESSLSILPPDQQAVFSKLTHDPQHIDDLAIAVKLPTHRTSALLTELELAGHVQSIGGTRYIRK